MRGQLVPEALCVHAGSGELQLDCKASRGLLAVPQDTSAVSHGDLNIDVSDFLKSMQQQL